MICWRPPTFTTMIVLRNRLVVDLENPAQRIIPNTCSRSRRRSNVVRLTVTNGCARVRVFTGNRAPAVRKTDVKKRKKSHFLIFSRFYRFEPILRGGNDNAATETRLDDSLVRVAICQMYSLMNGTFLDWRANEHIASISISVYINVSFSRRLHVVKTVRLDVRLG